MSCTENKSARPLMRKNFQEDFSVTIQLMNGEEKINFPDTDFTVLFKSLQGQYLCSKTNGKFSNCRQNEDGTLTCYLENHNLSPGILKAEVSINIDDPNYPDKKRKSVLFPKGEIELVTGPSSFDDVLINTALDYAIITAYDMAVKHGYVGTKEEFYATFSDLSSTLQTVEDSLSTVKDCEDKVKKGLEKIKDGKSAYELAKENGYQGSLSEWLASLKGVKGDKGETGWLKKIEHGTSNTEIALEPNTMNVWGVVSQLKLTLTPNPKTDKVTEYSIEFISPSDAPTALLLPEGVKWCNSEKDDGDTEYIPRIKKNMRYQADIVNNVIIMWGVPV